MLHRLTCSTNQLSLYRAKPMFRVTFCQQFLLVFLILRQADAVSDQCSELQSETDRVRKQNQRNEHLVGQCYVSGYYTEHMSSLCCFYMYPNVMWGDIILCMCRHSGTVIFVCSPTLCEWFLYCACVVAVVQLYAAQRYVSGYYTVHVSSLWYSYM
jgi:hypothetical protein